ncbi:MAG: SH3 domain-containing protein [Anaerolineae bacterium]|nr:SH3 domain-containing protein [Anaerolineae bacterium]
MIRWLFSLCILCFGFTSATKGQAEIHSCPTNFDSYLPPRLTVGEIARTTPGTPLNLRPEPTTNLARLAVIPPGAALEVIAGPECAESFVWWQVEYGENSGWVAEGTVTNNEPDYFIEPRGKLVIQVDENGIERRYIEDRAGNIELEGCSRPPDDYTQVQKGYATLNQRTIFMLEQAQRLYHEAGGKKVNFISAITQGSYTGGVLVASFGTHDGGGAVDISVRNPADFSVMEDEIEPMIYALRVAGFAAWLRDTGDLYADSPIHIHAIAIGDAELHAAALEQVEGEFGYLHGYNALPEEWGGPALDQHGGPIICNWMRELGYDDWSDITD